MPNTTVTIPTEAQISGPATRNSLDLRGVSRVGPLASPIPPGFAGRGVRRLVTFDSAENPTGPGRRFEWLLGWLMNEHYFATSAIVTPFVVEGFEGKELWDPIRSRWEELRRSIWEELQPRIEPGE